MLHMEIKLDGYTMTMPVLRPGDPPASITDHLSMGAVIVRIECRADDQGAVVTVSKRGAQVEIGTERLVISEAMSVERELGVGETYERPLRTSVGPGYVRLRHELGGGA